MREELRRREDSEAALSEELRGLQEFADGFGASARGLEAQPEEATALSESLQDQLSSAEVAEAAVQAASSHEASLAVQAKASAEAAPRQALEEEQLSQLQREEQLQGELLDASA